jgi:fatty acid desaturase
VCEKTLTSTERDTLKSFSQRSLFVALFTIATDWSIIVSAVLLSELTHSKWVYALSLIIISRQMNALFELHHHAMHVNLFPNKRWNHWLEFFYSLPLMSRVSLELDDHMEHHRTFNTTERDDLTWGTGYGLNVARRKEWLYMFWFLVIRPFTGILQYGDLKYIFVSKNWFRKEYVVQVGAFWLILIALFLAAGRLEILFWYWMVPRFTIFPILFFWDDMIGHYNSPKTGTREMRGVWFFFFSTHGTNYHNIHHLYPAIPWFRMRRATKLAIDEGKVDVGHGFINSIQQLLTVHKD